MENMLKEMIKLHEAQNREWKDISDSQHRKGNEIGQAHNAELDKFKKSIMPEEKQIKTEMMGVPAEEGKGEAVAEAATKAKEAE